MSPSHDGSRRACRDDKDGGWIPEVVALGGPATTFMQRQVELSDG